MLGLDVNLSGGQEEESICHSATFNKLDSNPYQPENKMGGQGDHSTPTAGGQVGEGRAGGQEGGVVVGGQGNGGVMGYQGEGGGAGHQVHNVDMSPWSGWVMGPQGGGGWTMGG